MVFYTSISQYWLRVVGRANIRIQLSALRAAADTERYADMLKTKDLERLLVESIVADAPLADSVDALVGHLLSGVPGYSARTTDGVIFEHSRFSEGHAVASGVVVMIDQTVEPLRVEFTLDRSGSQVSAGWVYFGDATAAVRYGSREYRKPRNAIIADPAADHSWKESFHRDGDGWHHEAA